MVKTRDMQANPRLVKTLFLLKKCRHGGFTAKRKRKTREPGGVWSLFTNRSQEVGVGFRHIGKVMEVHVMRTPAALGITRMPERLFFTHSATLKLLHW